MSKKEIEILSKQIVVAINKTTNDYDALDQVKNILKSYNQK